MEMEKVRHKHIPGLPALFLVFLMGAGCSESAPDPASPAAPPPEARKKPEKTARKSLVEMLPANTLFSIHVPDIGRTQKALSKTAVMDILQEKAVQKMMALPADKALQWVKELKVSEGIDLKAILDGIQGEAVLGVTLAGMEPGFLVAVDLGASYLPVYSLIRKLGKNRLRLEKRSDMDVLKLRMGRTGGDLEICFHRGRLILARGEDVLKNALRGPATPLTEHPGYRKSVKHTFGQDADCRLYVNLEAIWKLVSLTTSPEVGEAFKELGLDRAVSMVMATTIEGPDFRDRFVFLSKGENPILSSLLINSKVSEETLRTIPGNVESFFTCRVRLDRIPPLLRKLLAAADPASASDADRFLAAAKEELGLPLVEFLAALGEEVVMLKTPSSSVSQGSFQDNPFSGTILSFRMRDPKKVYEALDKLAQNFPGLKPETLGGYPGHSLRLPGDIPLRPRLVFKDGVLLAAADGRTLEAFLNRPRHSILESPTFELKLKEMPPEICALSYSDLRPSVTRLLEGFQEMMPMISTAMDGSGALPFDLQQLPDPDVINRHLTPVTSYVRISEEGMVVESTSPVGTLLMVVPVIAIGASVAIPNLMEESRTTGRRGAGAGAMVGFKNLFKGMSTGRGSRNRVPRGGVNHFSGSKPATPRTPDPVRNTKSTLYLLRSLIQAQAMLQKSAAIDSNNNGVGEYGTFAELAGVAPLRGKKTVLDPPILTTSCGKIQGGILARSGYYLRLCLPDKNGRPQGEKDTGGTPASVAAEEAEKAWCVLAWPQSTLSGTLSFYVDQKGRIYESSFLYRGKKKAPRPEDLLGNKGEMTSGILITGQATDGSRWTPVGQSR